MNSLLQRLRRAIAATAMLALIAILPSCSNSSDDMEPSGYSLLAIPETPLDKPPSNLIDTSSTGMPKDWRAASLQDGAHVYLGTEEDSICILLIVDAEAGSYLSCRYEPERDPLHIRIQELDGPQVAVFATPDNIRAITVGGVTCLSKNNIVTFTDLKSQDSAAEILYLDGTSRTTDFPPLTQPESATPENEAPRGPICA